MGKSPSSTASSSSSAATTSAPASTSSSSASISAPPSSSSYYVAPGPLTTIFTYPSDCFASLPDYWTVCFTGLLPRCYWSISASCFPLGGSTSIGPLNAPFFGVGSYSSTVVNTPVAEVVGVIKYSPGVLPSNFSTIYHYSATHLKTASGHKFTSVLGCLSGWNTFGYAYCTSQLDATYSYLKSTNGPISAIMPQIQISYAYSDLSKFTPASAPVLPTSALASYEAAESRAAARTRTSHHMPTATTTPPPQNTNGLSEGAAAGTGVGAAMAFLILVAIVLWLLRRRRRREKGGVERTKSTRAYVDTKAELPIDNSVAEKGGGDTTEMGLLSPQEILGKERAELEGGFGGYEIDHR